MTQVKQSTLNALRETLETTSAICIAAKTAMAGYFTFGDDEILVPTLPVALRLVREVAAVAQSLPELAECVEATASVVD